MRFLHKIQRSSVLTNIQQCVSDSSDNEAFTLLFLPVHVTVNMICDCHTKGQFCPCYCIYTKPSPTVNSSADTLHQGDVDPKGPLGFQLAVQKSITV